MSRFALLAAATCGICLIPVLAGQEALADADHAHAAAIDSVAPVTVPSASADSARSCWSLASQVTAAERALVAGKVNQRRVNCMDYDGTLCESDGQLAQVLGQLFQLNGFEIAPPAAGLADKHIRLHLLNYSLGDALAAISEEARLRFVYSGGAFFILDLRDPDPIAGAPAKVALNQAPAQRPGPRVTATPNLKGLVSSVGPDPAGGQDLVTLNIGAADGVAEKREFYITRGPRFICKIIADGAKPNQTICHVTTDPGNIQHEQIAPGDVAIGVITITAAHGR